MDFKLSKYRYTQTWFVGSEIRKTLLGHISKDKKINMLEIGCFEGLSACCFSDNILGHPESTLDCVDPYIASGTNPRISSMNVTSETEKAFRHNVGRSANGGKIAFHKMTSDDFFSGNTKRFNLIYLDGCHEPDFIKNDMENAFACLEPGGIMWMDDYEGGNAPNFCKIPMHDFLRAYEGRCKVIHKGYQLAIRKCGD